MTRDKNNQKVEFDMSNILLVSNPVDGVLLLQLNRPQTLNSLNTLLLKEIADHLAIADQDSKIRVAVITGSEKSFAAGADIEEMASLDMVGIMTDDRISHWQSIGRFSKPLLAAVNGYALGGGCELAMHADIILAGDNACFGQPEINLGIMPGAGGTQRLLRSVGKSLAMKMTLTGESISAEQALSAGLVSDIFPAELTLQYAIEMASLIAKKAPIATRLIKEAVKKAGDVDLDTGLRFERYAFTVLSGTEDRQEGLAAFKEKRVPNFIGK